MSDFILNTLLVPFSIILLCLWGISVLIRQVSFIDAFWSLGFVILAWMTAANTDVSTMPQMLVLGMVTIWGLRLSYHLFTRWWGDGEDKRYIKLMGDRDGLRRHIFSLIIVFALQGALILLIVLPLIDTILNTKFPIWEK